MTDAVSSLLSRRICFEWSMVRLLAYVEPKGRMLRSGGTCARLPFRWPMGDIAKTPLCTLYRRARFTRPTAETEHHTRDLVAVRSLTCGCFSDRHGWR